MNKQASITAPDLDLDGARAQRLRRWRLLKDRMTTGVVAVGGLGVIVAILLIFFYLLYEVAPLFESARVEPYVHEGKPVAPYAVPGGGRTLHLGTEEQGEVGLRINDAGKAIFFDTRTGKVMRELKAGLSPAPLVALARNHETGRALTLAHADGTISVVAPEYKTIFPKSGGRIIEPGLAFPYGEEPLALSDELGEITAVAARDSEELFSVVALDKDGNWALTRFTKEINFMTEEVELSAEHYRLPRPARKPQAMAISPDGRWLLYHTGRKVGVVDLRDPEAPELQPEQVATEGTITAFTLLLGGQSLLVADDRGRIGQWLMVRDDNNDYHLTRIRTLETESHGAITQIEVEHRRKGFLTLEADGTVSFFNATAENLALTARLVVGGRHIGLAPRANRLLVEDAAGRMHFYAVDNEHPEVSWSSLWSKVWYEGYDEPKYIWQSSASNNDFEPKFSLSPLAFGTLKAAFYAMLLATPLAICGAIYTAYFMAPALRRKVKPVIELMEALPTVILGFLAGLWLAPFVEANLTSIFLLLVVVPVGTLLFAYFWANAPAALRHLVPEGWDAALLVPVIVLLAWLALGSAHGVEQIFFGGDMRNFITRELGIDFDQRNALVVGLAMGFAVIPTIFSITEDAIFSVPKHLSNGSLALGATPWQTLTRVVLPTASPGIFSAVMIGMGRAVGETMIVLMATGNTPVMDMNIFEGMRTLAANIAVEMPEAEVASSHYRILFLAALVLFAFTFVVNTLAEMIRQRLRRKYGAL